MTPMLCGAGWVSSVVMAPCSPTAPDEAEGAIDFANLRP